MNIPRVMSVINEDIIRVQIHERLMEKVVDRIDEERQPRKKRGVPRRG